VDRNEPGVAFPAIRAAERILVQIARMLADRR
jgi:hypothetical protein